MKAFKKILFPVDFSDEGNALVVMATHGPKGLERVFFGSVADRVIEMSSTPVLSINPYRVKDV